MPECGICEEEAEKLYKCTECGTDFCQYCGSVSKLLCDYCLEEERDDL